MKGGERVCYENVCDKNVCDEMYWAHGIFSPATVFMERGCVCQRLGDVLREDALRERLLQEATFVTRGYVTNENNVISHLPLSPWSEQSIESVHRR